MEEKIINDNVDGLLREMEVYFKRAVEGHKPLQEKLDQEVKNLMDEFDDQEETKRFQEVKDFSDYIALSLSMPLPEELKEKIIETLVNKCKESDKDVGKEV